MAKRSDVIGCTTKEEVLALGGEKCKPPYPCGDKEMKKKGGVYLCRCGCGKELTLKKGQQSEEHDEFLDVASRLERTLIFVSECTSMGRLRALADRHFGDAKAYALLVKAVRYSPCSEKEGGKSMMVTVAEQPGMVHVRFYGDKQWYKVPVDKDEK